MVDQSAAQAPATAPTPGAVLELLKPITWFPPMWAFACGAVSTGVDLGARWPYVMAGIALAGPLVCGASQAVNDWFDREVDAINEPHRVIPSGRMPGRWGLWVAIAVSTLSLVIGAMLGPTVLAATIVGVVLAWAYSAPPFRLKGNGWWGNAAVGFSYESLPWITAAAAVLGSLPPTEILAVAVLYGVGAHGIMTLNDFKAIDGDRRMGVGSLPAKLGADRAARIASGVMAAAQIGVITVLCSLDQPVYAAAVAALLGAQILCMRRFLDDPRRYAVWYSAVGVGLYVTGMMVSAFALRGLAGGGM